jgi:type IV pilus assembly protein PilV
MPSLPCLRHAAGFTLIEVLIAMLILALGAGGVISMQIHALRVARESAYQASAVAFAAELLELLRNTPIAPTQSALTALTTPAAAVVNCHQQVCDATAMTTFLINDWQQRLQQTLPQARAHLCHDHAGNGEQLRWDCSNNAQDSLFIKIGWTSHLRDADTPGLMLASGR